MTDDNLRDISNLTPQEARIKFGTTLTQARQDAGYSVEELAYATKILAQFIVALEAGEFEKLPGTVFVRGFIKSISAVLATSPKQMLALVDLALSESSNEKLLVVQGSPGASTVRVGNERRDSSAKFKAVGQFIRTLDPRLYFGTAVLGLGLLLGYGAVLQMQKWARESDLSANRPKPRQAQPAEVVIEAAKPNENDPQVSGAQPTETPTSPIAVSEPMIELRVKEGLSMRINVDERGWETSHYVPDTYQIKFKDKINLLVFDAAAVDVFFNGKSLGSLGAKGKVRRLSFVAEPPVLDKSQNL